MSEIKEIELGLEGPQLVSQSRISPSSINSFYRCPREYFLSYIVKVPIRPNINLVKGGIVHSVLENFFVGYKPDMEDNLLETFNKVWEKNKERIRSLELTGEQVEAAKKDCWHNLITYYRTFKIKIDSFIETGKAENEQHAFFLLRPKFRENFVEDKELHCCGFIDRITEDFNGIVTIGDYKTSNKIGIGLPEHYERQLAIYSLLHYNETKEMPDFASVIFLRFGEEYLLKVNPSLLRYARDTILDVYSKTRSINIEDYPLKEGKLCKWCPFNDLCSGKEEWESKERQEKMKKLILPSKN